MQAILSEASELLRNLSEVTSPGCREDSGAKFNTLPSFCIANAHVLYLDTDF